MSKSTIFYYGEVDDLTESTDASGIRSIHLPPIPGAVKAMRSLSHLHAKKTLAMGYPLNLRENCFPRLQAEKAGCHDKIFS